MPGRLSRLGRRHSHSTNCQRYNFFKQPSRLDFADMTFRSRGPQVPRFARNFLYPPDRRAQGTPGARCTRGLVCNSAQNKTHTSIQVQRRQSGVPCAMVLTAYSALSPATGLFCHRHLARLLARLDTSVGVSGPHVFAVRIRRSRQLRHQRPPPPVPTSVTIASAPLGGTGWQIT
jgi:hypothetical protein